VTGGWRHFISRSSTVSYCSPNIIRIIKQEGFEGGHVALVAGKRNMYKSLVGKPEGKRLFGRPRRRWKNNTEKYYLLRFSRR
jgi:hypothetical protein